MKTLYPVPELKIAGEFSPSALGGIIGQRLAHLHRAMEATPAEIGAARQKFDKVGAKELKQARTFIEGAFRHAAASVCLAMMESDNRASEFLTGFAKGFATKPADLRASNLVRSTTPIYLLFLQGWRSVSKFERIEDFHAALCRHLGSNNVGKIPRIAKLCQRIGLRFRSRGRPPKKRK